MLQKMTNSLISVRTSRDIGFFTMFFALLSTYIESGLQHFVEAHIDRYLSLAVLSLLLAIFTTTFLKLLDALLARVRSGVYIYGLCLDTASGPHYIVGFFEALYDPSTDRHYVDSALCFDCIRLDRGRTPFDIDSPRARWIADRVRVSENHLELVYNFEKLGLGDLSRGGTPRSYLGLMLLERDRGLVRGVRYTGEVKYLSDGQDCRGYVYCEKTERRGATRGEWIATVERDLRDTKAQHLVDAVAQVRHKLRGVMNQSAYQAAHPYRSADV